MADNPALFLYYHSKTVERVVFLRPGNKVLHLFVGLVHMRRAVVYCYPETTLWCWMGGGGGGGGGCKLGV